MPGRLLPRRFHQLPRGRGDERPTFFAEPIEVLVHPELGLGRDEVLLEKISAIGLAHYCGKIIARTSGSDTDIRRRRDEGEVGDIHNTAFKQISFALNVINLHVISILFGCLKLVVEPATIFVEVLVREYMVEMPCGHRCLTDANRR